MKSWIKLGSFGIGVLLLGSGCASLQSVSVTNIPEQRAMPVSATVDNTAFLGLHANNDFADAVPEKLRRQCPSGKVTGIYSKFQTKWYVLVETRTITATGYCVPPEQALPPPVPAPPGAASRDESAFERRAVVAMTDDGTRDELQHGARQ